MRVSVIVCKATISRSRFTLLDAPTADPVAAVISVSGGIYLSFWMGVPVRAYIIKLPWPTRRFLQTMSIIKYNIKKKECNGLTYARGDDLEIGFCVAFVCNIFLLTPKKGETLVNVLTISGVFFLYIPSPTDDMLLEASPVLVCWNDFKERSIVCTVVTFPASCCSGCFAWW